MDGFLTNKYFCLALIVALGVLLYLYNTRDVCTVEGMDNVDLSVLAPELTEVPWAEGEEGKYKRVNNKFDRNADETVIRNLAKQGYKANFLPSTGEIFDEYEESSFVKSTPKRSKFPMPKDDHPELSQCQPCNCESEDTEEYYERKLNKVRQNKKRK